MTVLPILKIGDPALRRRADPVTNFDAELRTLVKDLNETLGASRGVGLSAPQLGVGLRVFAMDPDLPGNDIHLDHLVNPQLKFPNKKSQDGAEGCLSIPGVYLDTKRRMNVRAKGYTMHGDPVQIVGRGLLARCIQHENDHLDGVLFVDRQDSEGQARLFAALRGAAWWDGEIKVSPHR